MDGLAAGWRLVGWMDGWSMALGGGTIKVYLTRGIQSHVMLYYNRRELYLGRE